MVAGRQATYADRNALSEGPRGKTCPEPGCDCDGWISDGGAKHGGEPAHEWWAVWALKWALAVTPDGRLLGGIPTREVNRRLLSTPPQAVTP
jgi:hypothetical protein